MKKNEEKFMKDLLGIARHCLEIRRSDNRSMNEDILLRNLILLDIMPVKVAIDVKNIKL
ncbi:MAG: hypothetical protein WC365_08045 [Candidatus Babeliales bacterium]|jgi:hypothetical protein